MTARPLDTTRPTSTPPSPLRGEPLLDVSRLTVEYVTERGEVPACNEVSFTLRRGEILGLAGESGSGKSSLITALARLQRPPALTTGGEIRYHTRDGHVLDLVTLDERRMRALRWTDLAIVLQSAMAALNPVMRLQAQFADVMAEHQPGITRDEVAERTGRLLRMVGIAPERKRSYPHELSGGMRQRALIALALACEPELVLMDEPTTAVDVVMQRQIMGQILRLQRRLGFAVVFVTHDLSLLMEIADRIAIMYAGRIVEVGAPDQLYADPLHPYTRGLRDAFPPLHAPLTHLTGIPGSPPDLRDLPPGCAFHPRCGRRLPECAQVVPRLHQVPSLGGERQAACLLHDTTDPEGAR
ncbi:ABC transporter ATP-binding protein [Streptomyces sp. NBC_01387]|uniref:ABC transporter ATP-binding protein n=1 Tax=Streptomyces sp. NBC_01766 TaxID=2975936 RepID=UPI002DD819F3|nr:ABC transporter ATP-binding protein [Streptomyces sp. NBC_01766]WSC24209.1 ABC transporter ATP-binding protein [Streptomyces sp. NBC_01766]WSV58095.1 ABC transporter ATP-binding protein [Streptomyces sp. NBC_01014]